MIYFSHAFSLGSACSHIAAFLFKVEAFVRIYVDQVAVTSKMCQWNRTRKCAEPQILKNINFKRPKKGDLPQQDKTNPSCGNYTIQNFHSGNIGISKEKLKTLNEIVPNAAFFTSVTFDDTCTGKDNLPINTDSETESDKENNSNSLPEPITNLFCFTAINLSAEELNELCDKSYSQYQREYHQPVYDRLVKLTETQSLSGAWRLHRGGRITASNFYEACHKKIDQKGKNSLLNKLMNYATSPNTPALKYGRECEEIARSEFSKAADHENLSIQTTGLHIRSDVPFLGASPDALIDCSCHGKGLLEIKCPYKYRNGLKDWQKDRDFPINPDGCAKKKHKYYYQIQGQLFILERAYCYLFIWTPFTVGNENNTITVRIFKDKKFCEEMVGKLQNYFFNTLLPEIVTRRNDICVDNKQQYCCICKRPCFEPMIACDGIDCKTEWFHYACVDVSKAPAGNWYCVDCRTASK